MAYFIEKGGFVRYLMYIVTRALNIVDILRMNLLNNKIERLFDAIEGEQDLEIRARIRGCAMKFISLHYTLDKRVLKRQRNARN